MLWFHNIHNFKLEISNSKLGNLIMSTSFPHDDGFLELFKVTGGYLKRIMGSDIDINESAFERELVEYCIQKKWINKEWLNCLEWYLRRQKAISRGWSIFKKWFSPFLYRSIRPNTYKAFLKYGSTTANLTNEFEDENFKKLNLPVSEYIWATDMLSKAWEVASPVHSVFPSKVSIIVVYRKKYFKWIKVPNNANYVWVKKDKSIDYRDTIEAIIRVRYAF